MPGVGLTPSATADLLYTAEDDEPRRAAAIHLCSEEYAPTDIGVSRPHWSGKAGW